MKTVNIHLDKLVDKIEVKCSGDDIENRIIESLRRVVADKEEVHETRIEIIERFHGEKNEKGIGMIARKIERVVLVDGNEVYRLEKDALLKLPETPLDDFVEWLFKMPSARAGNSGKVG